jgi:hypothetical protein
MEVINPGINIRMLTDDGRIVHKKIIPTGAWNMDTTVVITVAHDLAGLLWKNILSVMCYISNNADTSRYPLNTGNDLADPGLSGGGIVGWTNTIVQMWRRTGGLFDDPTFNAAGGHSYIVIEYYE